MFNGLANLIAVEGPRELQTVEDITVFTGLSGLPGDFKVHVVYSNADDELYYNALPISFSISDGDGNSPLMTVQTCQKYTVYFLAKDKMRGIRSSREP